MVLVDGLQSEAINVFDRGLMYGDGVFRTLRVRHGLALRWPRHYRKLKADCDALGIACPSENLLTEDLNVLCAQHPESVIKIIVTRGRGQRGFAANAQAPVTRIVMAGPVPEYPPSYGEAGVKLRVCDFRLGWQPRLAGVKHLNRLENVLARMEWSDPAVPEGLLLDIEDNVIEGTMTNLFMVKEGSLITPDLSRCGVAGVQRELILETAHNNGISASVENISLDFLLQADEIFLVNSVIGAWQVRELLGNEWGRGKMIETVRQWLNAPCT